MTTPTPNPALAIIVAATADGAIGRRGDQLFYFRDDLRHFKALTDGHAVIMGRKTFEALPRGPLPRRRNIVVTRDPSYRRDGIETAPSIEAAIALLDDPTMAADCKSSSTADNTAFIIGGGEIYRQALPLASTIYLTRVDAPAPADADTFFPLPESLAGWTLAEKSAPLVDTPTAIAFTFETWTR